MVFLISRSLSHITPVRCFSLIPGSNSLYAEGNAFSVATAIAKCRAEVIERSFQHSVLRNVHVSGIAAHPNAAAAAEHAENEALEAEFLQLLPGLEFFPGISVSLGSVKMFLAKLKVPNRGDPKWITIFVSKGNSRTVLRHAVSRRLVPGIMKAWVEYRSAVTYKGSASVELNVRGAHLAGRETCLFEFASSNSLDPVLIPEFSKLKRTDTYQDGHHIVYFAKETL